LIRPWRTPLKPNQGFEAGLTKKHIAHFYPA